MTRPIALALRLALATGQSIGEVSGISISELSLDDDYPIWVVSAERSKNGQANRVSLSPLAIIIIREALMLNSDADWLFVNPRGTGPIGADAATKALGRARNQIGLADFRVHDLRRTAATRMAELGIAPNTISLILNHASASSGTVTSKVYVQYNYNQEKREALKMWGERLHDIVRSEV